MMLRSAEADPHVIERVQLARRRSVAWATRAEPPQPPPAPKCRPWPGEAEPPPGLVHPDSPLGPLGPPEGGPPGCLTAEAARRRGADSTRRSGRELGSSSVSRSGRLQGFAPPTSPSCRIRRCQRNDTRSFHGLCSPSRFPRIPRRSGRAKPTGTTLAEPRFDLRGTPRVPSVRGEPLRGDVQSRSLPEFPPFAVPKHGAGAPPGGRSRVQPPRLFSATAGPPLARPVAPPWPKPWENAGTVPVKSVRNPKS
jgi:hypothetical protein